MISLIRSILEITVVFHLVSNFISSPSQARIETFQVQSYIRNERSFQWKLSIQDRSRFQFRKYYKERYADWTQVNYWYVLDRAIEQSKKYDHRIQRWLWCESARLHGSWYKRKWSFWNNEIHPLYIMHEQGVQNEFVITLRDYFQLTGLKIQWLYYRYPVISQQMCTVKLFQFAVEYFQSATRVVQGHLLWNDKLPFIRSVRCRRFLELIAQWIMAVVHMHAVARDWMVSVHALMTAGKQAPVILVDVLSKQIKSIYGATKIAWKPISQNALLKDSSLPY